MKKIVNPDAPRPYFPDPRELDVLPDQPGLPDLFEFLDPEKGRVEKPEDWEERRLELLDELKYYLYGSRLDPLKEDTAVTAIRENYRYDWAAGVMPGKQSWFGYDAPPLLPEGSVTMRVMDLSAFGMGKLYADVAPEEGYVHAGADFPLPGGLGVWKAGEGWAQHPELVKKELLPTVTVEITIRDTNPRNAPWRSEKAAKEGVKHTFDIRFPRQTEEGAEVRDGRGYPILVCLGGLSEEQTVTLNRNGYVYLSVNDATDPDRGELAKYELLYPPTDPVVRKEAPFQSPYMVDSGNLMHSGWMASRALDALENYMRLSEAEKKALHPRVRLPKTDVYASAVTGCSNNGKRAIVAGVFDTGDGGDTRFDIIAPSDPGGGGASGFRCATEGQLFSYEPPVQNGPEGVVVHDYAYGFNETTQRAVQNTGEDQWFCDRAQVFTTRPDLADNVPIDAHSLLAAFFTRKEDRYFLTWTGEGQDAWLSSPATVMNTQAAREVCEFLGRGDAAVIVRDQAHANQDRDLPDLIALMDKVFYGKDKLVRRFHASLTAPGGVLAADGSGAILPDKEFRSLREMERSPYFLPSAWLPWSRPGKHVLWTEANSVTAGVGVTLTFHTDARLLRLRLPDGREKTAPAEKGLAQLTLSPAEALAGCYLAAAEGEKAGKEIELRGWTVPDALRHSVTDNSALGHDVGSGVAFTTPELNWLDPRDPPRLYLNGTPLPADQYDYDNAVTLPDGSVAPQSGYLQPYGATVILFEGTEGWKLPLGERAVFSLRNVRLEALRDFVVNMDVELEKFDPNGGIPNSKPRMRFRTVYRTKSTQTPVWPPQRRQDTPRLGLPAGEERWPLLGNWASDFDEKGELKPLDEIRPLLTAPVPAAYGAEVRLLEGDRSGFTLGFSEKVSTRDLALAVNVPGYAWTWAADGRSLRVDYDAPAAGEVTAFLFRSVDGDGNMIGGPQRFTVPAE